MSAGQRDIERTALAILASPQLVPVRERVRFMWTSIVGSDPGAIARQRFDRMIEEYCFNAALKAANGDPNHPRVLSAIYGPPHRWGGIDVPGSRLGGDNPDNHYSLIPIDDQARFELCGTLLEPRAADLNVTLMGNTTLSKTMASIEGRDLAVDGDGNFRISIGPEPAGPSGNHIQTRKGARFLFVRETRSDWRQRPARLEIRRLDPPTAPPRTLDEMVALAAEIMVDDVPSTFWWMRICLAMPANSIGSPFATVSVGGLYSQQVSFGHLRLTPDQAFVITVEPGGAAFRNIVLHDFWYLSLDVARRTSCLNSSQAAADADGRVTYVVAHRDPGIHNWLDPVGQEQILLVHRWQGLPREPVGDPPAIHGRPVAFAALESALPAGVRRIDADARAAQLERRKREFLQRFPDR